MGTGLPWARKDDLSHSEPAQQVMLSHLKLASPLYDSSLPPAWSRLVSLELEPYLMMWQKSNVGLANFSLCHWLKAQLFLYLAQSRPFASACVI